MQETAVSDRISRGKEVRGQGVQNVRCAVDGDDAAAFAHVLGAGRIGRHSNDMKRTKGRVAATNNAA
jgi:hypothetical protein